MSVLSTVQAACTSLDLEVPTVLYSSTDRTWVEMSVLVNTCAQQILEEYDWQRLIKTHTVTGDGVLSYFLLPSDYDRMVKDANLWSDQYRLTQSQQLQDFNEWLQLQTEGVETWSPRWMLFGGNLNVLPVLPSGQTLSFGYISNAIVNNGAASVFAADTDTFVLDERLLRLSIIWNWKKAKGFDFQVEAAEYAEAMNRARFKDVGARQSIINGRGAYPYANMGQTFP